MMKLVLTVNGSIDIYNFTVTFKAQLYYADNFNLISLYVCFVNGCMAL